MKPKKIKFFSKALLIFLILSGNILFLISSCISFRQNKKPNIILILVDDMGYGDLGCHGNPVTKTPNMNRLSEQSIRFTNFAVSPSCAPTRCALMTGKSEFKSNVTHTWEGRNFMDLESVTVARILKESGYVTGLFGKWHLGSKGDYRPEKRRFDETLNVPGDKQNSHYDPVLLRNGVEEKFKGYRTDIFFKEAMNFIEKHKDEEFFCYIPTYTPHAPLKVPEEYAAPYKNMENVNTNYFGMIANVDKNVGLLLNKLKQLGLEENTLVILMNDNGGTFGVDTYNAGMRGTKGTVWYGGIRSSSFWKWPQKLSTGDRPQIASHVDLLSTLADIAGAKIPKETKKQLEGTSLLPLLLDSNARWDDDRMLVHHRGRWDIEEEYDNHKYAHCTIRWKNYHLTRTKLCENPKCKNCRSCIEKTQGKALYSKNGENYKLTLGGEWCLYDIEKDLFQAHDIAKNHPDIVKKMSDFYESWWDAVVEKLDKYNSRH